ncbi:ABC transporter substrate-binding protein [Kribbella sp. NPDC048915]|uniref:ABC transporter substrate-binding protein n=1 Tax=Kribbella sp. NPDC048915 TaxID=3155148 RepID=UPI0033E490C7
MRFERSHTRRAAFVAIASSLALLATACGGDDGSGGGGDSGSSGGAALEGRGPINFATGKDTSGNLTNQVAAWNAQHPDEKVTVTELPESADQQRAQMIQNAQIKSDAFSVLNLDVVWTAEFAANRWVTELPEDQFPDLGKLLPSTVDTAKYRDKLYAVPVTSDGGLLYYRKDLLDKAGVQAPKTWAEMKTACEKVKALPEAKSMNCYAGQFEKYEGLTVNFSEAVNGAGGVVVGDDGKPNVNTPEALEGLNFLVEGFKSGEIPKAAITYKEEEGRRAFQEGNLIFHRNWPYVYALANKTDGSSKIAGKFAVAPLPGLNGAGVSTLGGHNYAISEFAKNKATAADFIKFMSSEERQKVNVQKTSQAPTWASLYDDPELTKQFPYLAPLKASIEGAKSRPKVVKYGDVTTAIQEAAYGALTGTTPPKDALSQLQDKLSGLITQ